MYSGSKSGFYIDTNIYLNLWQKEESPAGKPLWQIAECFLSRIEKENKRIYFSGFVLKELKFILSEEEFQAKSSLFENSQRFSKIIAANEDYVKARKLESESQFKISFFDCMHIVLSRKANVILVTRDRKLIEFANKHCEVLRPEDCLQ